MSNFKFNARIKNTNSSVGKRTTKFIDNEIGRITRHHIPPVNSDPVPRIIKVDDRHHKAYHLLVGNAKCFQDACHIIWRDWWAKNSQDPMPTIRGHQKI